MSHAMHWSRGVLAVALSLVLGASAFAQSNSGRVRPVGSLPITTIPAERPGVLTITIDSARGVDRSVDYTKLTRFGPWDDRNYKLTAQDLELLSPRESDVKAPLPAFYRVELRRANSNLPTIGPAQYPRVAVNGFLQKYGGVEINGVTYRGLRDLGNNRFEVEDGSEEGNPHASGILPNFLGGEKRVTTPAGAAESAVAINPANSNLVIAGTNGPGSGQKMWRSSDGGVTWSGPVNLSGTCCDPTVDWSPDGATGYMGALSTVVGSGTNVLFYRSTDNGATWTQTATLSNAHASDKEYIHVDKGASSPNRGNIYIAWHDSNVQKFARSTNGGTSFGSVISLDSANRGIGSDITSDKNGNVFFFYPTVTGGSVAHQIRVAKSTDGGATFAAASAVSSLNADFDFPIPAMETRRAFVYVSAGSDLSNGSFGNSVYVAWTDVNGTEDDNVAANNHSVIHVAFSRDGGATWTVRTPHATSDVNTVDRFNQWLSVDSTGRVFVMFYDTRNSSGRSGTDIYYSMSSDGGNTWSTAARLTTVTSKNIADTFEWGDYNGMDMVANNIMAIYTDNRDESGGTAESIDVYSVGGFAPSTGNQAPVANFTFTTSTLTANFTDTSTDSDGTIASRAWNFGDSTTSTATNPSHTYATAGTYSVSLTVTDNGGATNAVTKSVTVSASNTPPVANFTFTTSNLVANFTDSSTDSDGTIASRSWNFGDSTSSTATSPSHTYAAAGTYSVTLTVTDNGGATNAVTKSVTVTAPPPNVLTNGVPVTGLAATTGNSVNYTMVVPAGATGLKFVIASGTGDADLYVKFGSAPTDTVYDCRPFLSGNAETCNIATAQAGTYFVRVKAFSSFTGVSLTGSYTIAGPVFTNSTVFTINDNSTIQSPITVTGISGNAPAALKVPVDITHTFQGDLKIDLIAPNGTTFNLWNRTGGGTDNIKQTFTVNASAVVANGTWKLQVADQANGDVGTLNSWSLQF